MIPPCVMMGWLEELQEHLDDHSDIMDGGGGNNYMRWHAALEAALFVLNKRLAEKPAALGLYEALEEASQLSLDELFEWQRTKARAVLDKARGKLVGTEKSA